MSRSDELRLRRANTILNLKSKVQETTLGKSLKKVVAKLERDFPEVELHHTPRWNLAEIIAQLSQDFPDVPFADIGDDRWMAPDGGILSIVDKDDKHHVILISEVKNQGTNDKRKAEGKQAQARGNAIERLGKNVIGLRAAMLTEDIMPFICFGYGCDFAPESYIVDRVVTIAMFGPLNDISVLNRGDRGQFNRGSFFFREKVWGEKRMSDEMYEVASRSVHYYFSKYGKRAFARRRPAAR